MAGKCIQIKAQTLNLKELEWFMEMGQRFLFSGGKVSAKRWGLERGMGEQGG